MRIVHFSDTHLGHQQFSRTDPKTGLNQREQDHYRVFGDIVQHCLDTRPDLVIHAGDLFDGVRPSNRALAVALDGFVRLSRAGIPVVCIAGNHEHPKMVETGSPFRLFEHLDGVHAVFKGRAETIEVAGRTVHAVPQCADNAALRAEMERVCAQADTRRGQDILVLHGGVLGMEAFHHAEFNELSLDPAWFTGAQEDRFAYVALGHYHGRQEIAPRVHYCGAPDRVSMRESGEEKGFLEVSVGGPDVRFVTTMTRPYADLAVLQAQGLDAGAVVAACEEALRGVPTGAVCRLRIRGLAADLRGSLDWKTIRQAAPDVLDLRIEAEFDDDGHRADTGAVLRGLAEEFEQYASTYPLDGIDRQELLRHARGLLQEAQQ